MSDNKEAFSFNFSRFFRKIIAMDKFMRNMLSQGDVEEYGQFMELSSFPIIR